MDIQPTQSLPPTTQAPTPGPPTTSAPTMAPATPEPTSRSPTPFGYTYNPTTSPTTLAPTQAPPEPFFLVVDSQPLGACFVTDSGSCVSNGNGVVDTFMTQSCNIAVLRQGVLSTPVGFNVDALAAVNIGGHLAGDGDTLIGGSTFSGQQSPANQRVEAADALFWRYTWDATSVSVFRVCASRCACACVCAFVCQLVLHMSVTRVTTLHACALLERCMHESSRGGKPIVIALCFQSCGALASTDTNITHPARSLTALLRILILPDDHLS